MHLIQVLLPLYDNRGQQIPSAQFKTVKRELTARFQGLTAYSRYVAEGYWGKGKAKRRDDIIVYEVMVPSEEKPWWKKYRTTLEKRFRQQSIVIRMLKIRVL